MCRPMDNNFIKAEISVFIQLNGFKRGCSSSGRALASHAKGPAGAGVDFVCLSIDWCHVLRKGR